MASPFQQQALHRKLIYLGLVVALFTASWVWRRYVVEKQADDLHLLEQSHGDVSAFDRLLQLTLTGSRGLVTTALWWSAQEQQKKNQWNELELTVRSLTRLQPHFITPWLFQSWNLAYNVSVESDRVRDKYFYIVRGIQLLAEGERQNRYQPDLRRELGFYHQHKICQSDENNVLRSLFQLSCIASKDRDPDLFRNPPVPWTEFERLFKDHGIAIPLERRDRVPWEEFEQLCDQHRVAIPDRLRINWDELEKFCRAHPQLVRRLHSPPLPYDLRREYRKFRCGTAQELIQFLDDNKDVPSLYVDKADDAKGWAQGKRKEDDLERFPVLPPDRPNGPEDEWTQEKLAAQPAVPDEFDAYTVSRAWYAYSQEALPRPARLPGDSEPIRDRLRERLPGHMATIIFRSSPARAQSYVAERLQEEGWFDSEPFALTGWFKKDPSAVDQPLLVGDKREWSLLTWTRAEQAWKDYGRSNHLWFEDPAQQRNMEEKAEAFRKSFGGSAKPFNEEKLDDRQREQFEAVRFMEGFHSARHLTNFAFFLARSTVETQPRTVMARKLLYQAEHLRLAAQPDDLKALALYEDPRALQGWREVLEQGPPDFRNSSTNQEDTFDIELKYLRLYRKVHEANLTRDLALQSFLGQAVAPAPLGAEWVSLGLYGRPQLLPSLTIQGPFDKDSQGRPFIPEEIKNTVLVRRDLKRSAPPPGRKMPAGIPPTEGMRLPQGIEHPTPR